MSPGDESSKRDEIKDRVARLSPSKRALLEKRLRGEPAELPRIAPIPRRPVEHPADLSFAQTRLWFLDRLEPGNPALNRPTAFRLTGPVDPDLLEKSLNRVIQRHETLRASFPMVNGRPSRLIAPVLNLTLPLLDLTALPKDDREARFYRLASEQAQHPFDLTRAPLIRSALFRFDSDEHILLVTIHHILFDAWSAALLRKELALLYDALVTGDSAPLPDLPIQYADYAVWQRNWLRGELLDRHLAYWRQKLAGDLPVLQLPATHPPHTVRSSQGTRLILALPQTLSEPLSALSRRENVTLFTTLLSAFKVLLSRYTAQEDIVVGSLVAGRTRIETEHLIGLFVNTLVLRSDLSGNPTFSQLLKRVREVLLGAISHQDLPFERVVHELNPDRTLSRTPLFQVLFNMENIRAKAVEVQGVEFADFEFDAGVVQYDLTLEIIQEDGRLTCSLKYNSERFDPAAMARMLAHYQVLLEGIVSQPGQRLSQLPLLTEAERHQLLVAWNDTRADYPKELGVHQLFEAQVERTPHAVAILFGEEKLTYGELNGRANQLASYLRTRGVGPGVTVAVCTGRSLQFFEAVLAILKTGGTTLPMDPAYPASRLAFMLEDAEVQMILTREHLAGLLPPDAPEQLLLDHERGMFERFPETESETTTWSETIAFTFYTSGSTGLPKGVLSTHRGIVNHLAFMTQTYDLDATDTVLQLGSLAFDGSIRDTLGPLLRGAKVVLVNDTDVLDPSILLAKVRECRITCFLCLVPSRLRMLLERPVRQDIPYESVRLILFSGEELWQTDCRRAWTLFGDQCQLVNQYGPTETTLITTFYPVPRELPANDTVPVGKPISNSQIYITDSHLNPVPIGVRGELHIGGDGLTPGYLKRPQLTAEAFIPNVFTDKPNARLYKSGDLARYQPDGNIELLGRPDRRVKVRGNRIELGEIEAVLRSHPGLQQTAVLLDTEKQDDQRLLAYVVPGSGQAPAVGELRDFLSKQLPGYMVPSLFVLLEELPLTPNGKIDRHALPTPDLARQHLEKTLIAPRTATEKALTAIWGELLGHSQIGIQDNFFELGGHSLLAVRLFAEIEQGFDRRLPLSEIFQAPTIEQLAAALQKEGTETSSSSLVPIQPDGVRPPLFLLHALAGHVLYYRDLARYLGPTQPIYGLPQPLFDGELPRLRIEDMAAQYVREICSMQQEGPYFLGGLSFGGLVAFEMAQQLHAAGEHVALLALLDTRIPNHMTAAQSFSTLLYNVAQRADFHAGNLRRLKLRGKVAYVLEKARIFKSRAWGPIKQIEESNAQARRDYVPQLYPGRVTLFQASKQPIGLPIPEADWSRLAGGGLDIHEVPGYHASIVAEPHVKQLSTKLGASLEKAQSFDPSETFS